MTDKCKTFVARWDHAMCSTCGEEHDRPAPTPTPAPGLDLDAVERAERAMTPGPWSMRRESHFVQIRAADLEELATTEQARGVDVANAAGIVALRNAAPALIAEVRALRRHYDAAGPDHNLLALLDLYHEREQAALAKLAEAKRLGLEFVALHREAGNCDGWGPFPGMRSKRMAAIAAALEAL